MMNMKIYLLDINTEMTQAWKTLFDGIENIEVVNQPFDGFMKSHLYIDCVVSPANSFGLMDGGFDLAITEYFGNKLQKRVQRYIIKHYYGEQPVGTSIAVAANENVLLIHTPSMRYPQPIIDKTVIYNCMRSTLITAMQNNVGWIVIPAFGGCTGRVSPDVIADMMYRAYVQLLNPPDELNWDYVRTQII
ncbi:MAG TPA: macro domain-containing protein [Mobilitalea sp.]|nr:macro domain-containing protein [Mobilitalea sp.]